MSDNIFNGETTPEVVQPTPSLSIPPEAIDFIGDGKKYSSVEDALKSVPHAQTHIKNLEQELAELREAQKTAKTLEQVVEEIKSGIPTQERPSGNEIKTDDIVKVVDTLLVQRQQAEVQKANVKAVVSEFTKVFGEKAEEVYTKIANDTGLSVANLNKLAATSPTAVLKLAGIGVTQPNNFGKSNGSVNTEALNNTKQEEQLSAKLPKGATTKDVAAAWRAAGEIVKRKNSL